VSSEISGVPGTCRFSYLHKQLEFLLNKMAPMWESLGCSLQNVSRERGERRRECEGRGRREEGEEGARR
jgi:hypothetical protein